MSVTLMLRDSETIWRMAGMPSTVAGIFTYRFGCAMRSQSSRAWASVESVSRANAGLTSTET